MFKMKNLFLILTLILLFFISSCGEKITTNPSQSEEYIGKGFNISISYDRSFSPFENITISSLCNEVEASSNKITSGKKGEIIVTLKIKEAFESNKKCLMFESKDYSTPIEYSLSSKKQAKLDYIKYDDEQKYSVDYNINLSIKIMKKDQEHQFVIKFNTSSDKVYGNNKNISSFLLENNATKDTVLLTPAFKFRMDDNGDVQRVVELNIRLFENINGVLYYLDNKSIKIIGSR